MRILLAFTACLTVAAAGTASVCAQDATPATPPAAAITPEASAGASATPSAPATEAATSTSGAIPDTPPPTVSTDTIGGDIRKRILTGKPMEEEAADWQALLDLYETRGDAGKWVSPTGYTKPAQALIAELQKASEWGLNPKDYVVTALPNETAGATELSREQRVEGEWAFGLTVLKYVRHARGGRVIAPPKQLSSYLDRFPQFRDPKAALDEALSAGDAGEALRNSHPKHPQFERLRKALIALVANASSAPEIVTIPNGAKLMPGQKDPQVALLRKRLGAAVAAGADESLYDPALVDAVKAYQTEKGMRPDGIVGNATRNALNAIERPNPDKLIANMEQWRWMPADMGKLHVWVNIPDFMVRVVKDGVVVLEERIVTGELSKQTPVFSDEIETIYFHPRWNVPASIKVLELYPSMARGGGAIQRQGLKVMYNGREVSAEGIDWGTADIRSFDIYQPPGPTNVLGLVKFTFPNKHGVYLHDTTSKHLFNEPSRPFSHGCMRVRNPLALAEVLLKEDQDWTRSDIDNIVTAKPVETPVEVKHHIPVHVTYFTETIGDDGKENLFKDIYGHEQRIKLALAGKWNQISVGQDHLAPVKLVRVPQDTFVDPFTALFGGFGGPPPGTTTASTGKKSKNKSASNGSLMDLFSGF